MHAPLNPAPDAMLPVLPVPVLPVFAGVAALATEVAWTDGAADEAATLAEVACADGAMVAKTPPERLALTETTAGAETTEVARVATELGVGTAEAVAGELPPVASLQDPVGAAVAVEVAPPS